MARIGRPPKAEPTTQWTFRLPISLASKWDLVLADPLTGAINPNVRQDIFIPILQRLWTAVQDGNDTVFVGDIAHALHARLSEDYLT